MLLTVKINMWQQEWKNLTPEQYAILRESVPSLPADKEKMPYDGHFIVDDVGMRAMHRVGVRMEISDDPNIDTMLVKIQRRMDDLDGKVQEMHQFNDRIQICIPDQQLLKITEVTWMEDACTKDLQDELKKGWRILAVCPPNAKRRPDYILGRIG